MTMTFTDFNRRRSTAMRAARRGQDVIVHSERAGDEDVILITKLNKPRSTLARGLAEGWIRPPKISMDAPFVDADIDAQRASAALAEFEADRQFS
jgi:hypothetical protein